MVNIVEWFASHLHGMRHAAAERRGGQERRQCADRRHDPRDGEQLPARRQRQRRYQHNAN